jgi:hypothetical protein
MGGGFAQTAVIPHDSAILSKSDPNHAFLVGHGTEGMRQQCAFLWSRRQGNRYKCQAGRDG